MFCSINRADGKCRSIKVARTAPRLIASRARAPVPANKIDGVLAHDRRCQNVEHRLAEPIFHRPRARIAAVQNAAAAHRAADNPQRFSQLRRVVLAT